MRFKSSRYRDLRVGQRFWPFPQGMVDLAVSDFNIAPAMAMNLYHGMRWSDELIEAGEALGKLDETAVTIEDADEELVS